MTEKEKKAIFVRDHLSPFLAAAKNDKWHAWQAEYMSGGEAQERFHPYQDCDFYDEVVVCTVTLDTGEDVHYFCNVSWDSIPSLVSDVWKIIAYK